MDADDVERVLRAHGGVFDPEGYLEPLPEAVDVLFERVVAMADPQEAGRILGWISRTCATPLVMVGPPGHPELEPYREKAREAAETHIGEIREWLNDDTAERRTAAAHLLSLSTSDEKDAETLLAIARRDPQPVPAATALLGAALICRIRFTDQSSASSRRTLARDDAINERHGFTDAHEGASFIGLLLRSGVHEDPNAQSSRQRKRT